MATPPEDPNPLPETLIELYSDRFGAQPEVVVRAPGRVNLIGEHTDYNDGFVLPVAIDREAWIALRPRADRQVHVYSIDFRRELRFSLDGLRERGDDGWGEYLKGTAWALQDAGMELRGWEGTLAGDVPIGAGLSSSAALELATARAFAEVSGLGWDPSRMAQLGQRAENEWVGVNCGIMDQMISAVGRQGHAVLIDCRTLETRAVPIPRGTVVVILDTRTRRGLVESAYNERRRECEAAAAHFGVPALRDLTSAELARGAEGLSPLTHRRARHVVTENERTLEAAEAMEREDAVRMGELMNASHASLRDDFEVSSRELDLISSLAQGEPGCYGARMTGAGFGGCAVALVRREAAEGLVRRVAAAYQESTGLTPQIYVCEASAGASAYPPPDGAAIG